MEKVIAILIDKVKSLEADLYFKDLNIENLKKENAELKGERNDEKQ